MWAKKVRPLVDQNYSVNMNLLFLSEDKASTKIPKKISQSQN